MTTTSWELGGLPPDNSHVKCVTNDSYITEQFSIQ